jgi:type IV pilus assembly protein PilW
MKVSNNVYSLKTQYGFSLLEVFVAMTIGLVIFAGVLSVFVGLRTTTSETSSYGELQENGRFAISVLSDDLLRQDFWGDYTGSINLSNITPVPNAPVGECTVGINNGSFPLATGHFRTLWGQTVTSASIMGGCRTDAKIGSDILQLKRVISSPLGLVAGNTAPANNYYFMSNMDTGSIFAPGDTVPDIKNAQVWEYQHHIYYIREETQGTNTVPVLMQGRLANTLSFAPIIDGIEMIRFEYGIDMQIDPTDAGYGIVDVYIPANDPVNGMTDTLWDNELNRIISVKIYVLARGIREDNKYENKNTYKLGAFNYVVDDNYRRLLFSSTVTLYNAGMDMW